MKARIAAPLILCILLTLASSWSVWIRPINAGHLDQSPGGHHIQLQVMNNTASDLYAAALSNERHLAYNRLMKLKQQTEAGMLRGFGTEAGWVALDNEMTETEALLLSGSPSRAWAEGAARIALAADAMSSGSGGLWLQYEKLLEDDLAAIRKAWKRSAGDPAAAAAARLNSFSAHAGRIAPAALMAGSAQATEQLLRSISEAAALLDAKMAGTADERRLQLAVEAAFVSMENASSAMFEGEAYRSSVQPISASAGRPDVMQWALFLGTLISAVLTWTGWRKYKQNPFGVKTLR
ncbi:sporulation protein YpjB [Paenibacillus sp. CAU 1782]